MLTVYKNGQEHTGYDNVPVRRRKLSRSKHSHSRRKLSRSKHIHSRSKLSRSKHSHSRSKLSRSKHGHSQYSHHGCAKLSRATTTYEHDGWN